LTMSPTGLARFSSCRSSSTSATRARTSRRCNSDARSLSAWPAAVSGAPLFDFVGWSPSPGREDLCALGRTPMAPAFHCDEWRGVGTATARSDKEDETMVVATAKIGDFDLRRRSAG
jgi:hypothetical protein